VWQHQDTDPELCQQESHMSAKKLGRIAGLVLVLAAVFGGSAIGQSSSSDAAAARYTTQDFNWGAGLSTLDFDWK
jgi:hypothetical protein